MRRMRVLRLDFLLPALVLALGVVASVLFMNVQRSAQSERLMAETQLAVSNFGARLETHMAARLNAGLLLGQRFLSQNNFDAESFREETQLLHELFGDFQALNWVDADGVIRIVTPVEGNAAARGLNLRSLAVPALALRRAELTGRMQVTPPLELAQGGTGFVAYVPIVVDGAPRGFINIVFRAAPLMQNALGENDGLPYGFRVIDGQEVLFTQGPEEFGGPGLDETRIQVGDRTWRLQVVPLAERMTAMSGLIDEATLILGGLASMLLAMLSRIAMLRQASLAQSEARFSDFASASSDWYMELDAKLRTSWFSEGVESYFGAPRQRLLGRSIDWFRAPAGDEAAWAAHMADLRAHRPFRDVVHATIARGKRRWLRVSGVPQFDSAGTFTGYRCAAVDTTELVQSRSEVEQANTRLFAAVENLNEMFSLWDKEDRLVFGNRIFRELNANNAENIVPGTRFVDYLRGSIACGDVPDTGLSDEEFLAYSLRRRHDPRAEPFEVARNDGTILRLFEQNLPDGGIVTVGQDVTRQRQDERALRASEERLALASQQLAIWDWDLETDNVYMSPGFAERLGYAPDEFQQIKADSVASIIHPDDVDGYLAKLRSHLDDPTSGLTSEHRFRTRSGEYRWFLAIGQAETGPDGRAIRSTGVLTDLTDRIELEAKLQHAQKMEAIGNLTGGVAHDFNNLLAVILGNLELIKDIAESETIRGFADAGITATQRGADLVRSMLSFARRARLDPRLTDLNGLINEPALWFSRVLPEHIKVEVSMESDLLPARVDPSLTQNAVLNLVLNARDAMPEGGTLTLRTQNVTIGEGEVDVDGEAVAPGPYVVLEVGDTGPGIDMSNQNLIFQPFFTTKPPGAGSGLGLSMVHGFMKQSGGMVQAVSEPGKGARFRLYFRAAADQLVTRAPEQRRLEAPGASRAARLYVVEDEAEVLKVLVATLEGAGYEVRAATSGDEAFSLWNAADDIDVLITDIVMPGQLQGTHLVQALRARHPRMPVIFLSGYTPESAITEDATVPGDIRLTKPVNRAELIAAVEAVLAFRLR